MVTQRKRRNLQSLTYFYWDGHLCKKLSVSRMDNLLYAWDYKDNRRVSILLSNFKKNRKPAYTTPAVKQLIGMSIDRLYFALNSGKIPKPARPVRRDEEEHIDKLRRKGYMWSEEDIMNLHDWVTSLHKMRPRKDGLPRKRPRTKSKAEIRSKISGNPQTFVQTEDGRFVPIWKEY